MRIDISSFAHGTIITTGGGTPSWGTALGQGYGYKFTTEGYSDLLLGMLYCSVPLYNVKIPLGKGGTIYTCSDRDCGIQLASVFKKVYVNNELIENASFALCLLKESSTSHSGRRTIKYSDKITYILDEVEYTNAEFRQRLNNHFNWTDSVPWFIYDITIKNLDELHFSLIKSDRQEFNSSQERKEYWNLLIANNENILYSSKIGRNILYYGVPGVGKSYEIEQKLKDVPDAQKERITFHPDYSYGEFVGQLLPQKNGDSITYEFVPGAFTRILKKALTNPDKHYYFVIEEINRGNASAIFGDIFQLLDRDENTGTSKYKIQNKDIQESLRSIGINMDEGIYVPGNLSIYATMNTCDQNVFVLDTAFKRRWIYRYVKNPRCAYGDTLVPGSSITWQDFLDTINKKICEAAKDSAIDEDKQLGAYFISEALLTDEEFAKENFADKVLMYLWTDVVRFDKSILFSENYNSFKDLRDAYIDCTEDNFISLFTEGVFAKATTVDENS